MVVVLHHLPREAALRHAAELLEPGGRLLVVGLVKHPQPAAVPVDDGGPPMPVRDPAETVAEIAPGTGRPRDEVCSIRGCQVR